MCTILNLHHQFSSGRPTRLPKFSYGLHFYLLYQSTTTLNSTMSEASIGPQRNGKPPPSSAFSFSQSDKNLLNITDSFAAFSAEQVCGSYDIAYR